MTVVDLQALAPLIVLAGTLVVTMLGVALRRDHGAAMAAVLLGMLATLLSIPLALEVAPHEVTALLVIDRFALLHLGLIVAAAAAVSALALGYLRGLPEGREEYYLLLAVATLGGAVLAMSRHFASLVLGLETLSIGLYGLIGYHRSRVESLEAALKYLILAAASSAALFFGIALIYAEAGTLGFAELAERLAAGEVREVWLSAGVVMILVGLGFKLALVPFHMWTPDVYQGAPAPTVAFLATVSKAAVVVVTVRLFTELGVLENEAIFSSLATIAVVTIVWGNLLAVSQRSVKRLLGCSSIAHMGYLLVGFLAAGPEAVTATTVYLVTYVAASLVAFGVVSALSPTAAGAAAGDLDDLETYRGLGRRSPWLAGLMTLSLISLTGIPLTPGFIGKYSVIAAGVGAELWVPVGAVIAGTAISLAYYLRVVKAMYLLPPDGAGLPPLVARGRWTGWAALLVLGLIVLWLGVLPSTMIELIRPAVELLLASSGG